MLLYPRHFLLPPKGNTDVAKGVSHSEWTTKTQTSECKITHRTSSEKRTRPLHPPKALWSCRQELALLLAGRKPTQNQLVVFARLTSTGTSFLLPGLGLPHHPLVHTICHLDEINVVMTNACAFPNFPPGCGPPCIHHATQGFGVLGAGIGVGVKGILFSLCPSLRCLCLRALVALHQPFPLPPLLRPLLLPPSLPRYYTLPRAEQSC